MVKSTVNSKWALAYLNGRAKSFRKGNTPIAGVTGSIAMARRHEVSDSAIAAVLGKWNLSWDPGTGSVSVARSIPQSAASGGRG